MKGFLPTLFERLSDEAPHRPEDPAPLRRWSLEELKNSVARDLESLLNSRCGPSGGALEAYPQAMRSLASFGMADFVGLSLANPADRARICRSIERTIVHHEPRLKHVAVGLRPDQRSVGKLVFTIQAVLHVPPATEPVGFDAVLHPGTQQYAVASARRLPSQAVA